MSGLEEMSKRLAQRRLDWSWRVSEFPFGFLDRKRAGAQSDPNSLGRGRGRTPGYMVGDKLQHRRGCFRGSARNRYVDTVLAARCPKQTKNIPQPETLATKKVAMADLAALHRQDQTRRDVTYVNKVHDKVEIQLHSSVQEMPEHRCWRRKVMVVRPDRHRRRADDYRKSRFGSLQRQSFREQFRTSIRTRHVGRRP